MLITRIKVSQLYGLHNYDILFNKEECVKIIHAPNGYGKTTILKLVKAIIEGHIQEIKKIPFEAFLISFNEATEIMVMKDQGKIIYEFQMQSIKETYVLNEENNFDERTGGLQESLKDICKKIPIYFIDANRLWTERNDVKDNGKTLLPTVLEYAKELSEWMKEALAKSNFCGQELDRSFPNRLIQSIHRTEELTPSVEQIRSELYELEKKRTILEGAGLFSPIAQPLSEDLENIDETTLKVLNLYIQDSKEKLKVFENLATKINLLCELINKRFSYKVMEVNMKDGFVFKVPSHEKLQADKLSSGEQNELILMFVLLFKAPSQALILMDEPEISLHIAWQQSFLEDMQTIAKLSDIRMLIATHSPDIINGRWDLTTGLEEEE